MANPEAALKIGFERNETFPYRIADPGHLEPDDFYINDVALRISPEQIHVEKQAFNHEWQTLRTSQSQKAKSGHSVARVSFQIVFKGSNRDDIYRLICLVSGLRATPFCVVHNLYLDKMLGRPDPTGPVASGKNKTIQFRPIMLAISSMTFSTMGHEQKPDGIKATFDFLWFNYLPLTRMVAFKAGDKCSRPGHAWESPIWQKFYEPFMLMCRQVEFPHSTEDYVSRTTNFVWREFMSVPKGHPAAAAAAKDLANTLKKNPSRVLEEMRTIVGEALSSDLPNPGLLTQGSFDTLYRRLVHKGVINPNDEMRNQLGTLQKGAITGASSDVLSPIFRKLYNKNILGAGDKNEIEIAASILASRFTKLQNIAKRGDIDIGGIGDIGQFTKILEADAKFGVGGNQINSGGLQLFGRKHRYSIQHSAASKLDDEKAAVIQQVIVSFENILATIPMIGYRYPLLQHVGSMDARVTFIINAKNDAAGKINEMYDAVENVALRYKHVPQGFTNLYIFNDFLQLFGLSEFITEQISTDAIPTQPARSLVSLSLTQAGVTSDTKLNDAEELKQEYVPGNNRMFKEIWNILQKDVEQFQNFTGKRTVGWWHAVGIGERADIQKPTDLGYYLYKPGLISADNRSAAYLDIVQKICKALNDFTETIHKQIFDSIGPIENNQNLMALMEIEEDHPGLGFIPFANQLKKNVKKRLAALHEEKRFTKMSARDSFSSNKVLAQQEAAIRAAKSIGASQELKSVQKEVMRNKSIRIQDLGIPEYQNAMRQIFDDVVNKYLTLPKFQRLLKLKDQLGINKGLMAYPDFRKQIASVAGAVEGIEAPTDTQLMKYEPDCYFWYDIFNGGASSPLSGVIDDYYITEAKRHSLAIYQNAQNDVAGFFKDKYQLWLNNSTHTGPYDVLVKDFDGSELREPFYDGEEICNSTKADGGSIVKNTVCDPNAKIYTNWYPKDSSNRVLNSKSINQHTTDMFQLWEGVSQATGDGANTAPIPGTTNANRFDTMGDDAPNKKVTTKDINDAKGKFAWPIYPPPGFIPSGSKFGAPRNYRKNQDGSPGTHKGIDMPEPSRGSRKYGPDDGIYGSTIYAARNGTVTKISKGKQVIDKKTGKHRNIGGWQIWICHEDGWSTGYFHIKPGSIRVEKGKRVSAGQPIAQIGRTGNLCSATHLHFAVVHNGVYLDPLKVLPELTTASRVQRRGKIPYNDDEVGKGVTSTLSSPLREAIKEFERDLYNGQAQSMMRAYPAFKLYFIEDDSNERKRLAFDDFFSYNAVQSIRVIQSRKIAADLCEIYLTNISGVLSNRKFRQHRYGDRPFTSKGEVSTETTSPMQRDTRAENPIASLLLQEGMNIHLRLGYCVDEKTEILTKRGWLKHYQLTTEDIALTLNHKTGMSEWAPVEKVNRFYKENEEMVLLDRYFHSSLTTKNHKWPILKRIRRSGVYSKIRTWTTSDKLDTTNYIIGGAICASLPKEKIYSDDFVKLVAWFYTEGQIINKKEGRNPCIIISQDRVANPDFVNQIYNILTNLYGKEVIGNLSTGNRWGQITQPKWKQKKRSNRNENEFRLNSVISKDLLLVAPNKYVTTDFISKLTKEQLQLFISTSNKGDGNFSKRDKFPITICQKKYDALIGLELAAILFGYRTHITQSTNLSFDRDGNSYHMYRLHISEYPNIGPDAIKPKYITYTGTVWCPTTKNATWLARRNGTVYYTGNSSDPDRMPHVFNGKIMEVQFSDSDDLVRIIAQSYATELVQDIKGIEKPGTKSSFAAFGWDFWGFTNDASTGRILEEMIAEPEVLHFGRWEPSLGGALPGRELLTSRWTFQPQPADDNIFAPNSKQDLGLLGDGIFFKNLKYIIYRTTIWDIFQEMTLRHPNFIASPVPYQDVGSQRMTMFFGLPNQLYFARHPTAEEQIKDAKLKQMENDHINNIFLNMARNQLDRKKLTGRLLHGMAKMGSVVTLGNISTEQGIAAGQILAAEASKMTPQGKVIENIVSNFYREARLSEAKKAGYIKPFRNYHLITSSNHIICNNIRASSRDVNNTIVIKYGKEVEIKDGEGEKIDGVAIKGKEQEFTLKLDNALPPEEIRTQMGQFINVTNEELAKRYALGLLCRNLKEIYKGELIIVGNPKIKPYDICYIFDEYTDMVGAIEVEEVHHVFDQQHGFRTEIKPDMLVQAAEWSLLSSAEALGIVMEGVIKKVFGNPTNFIEQQHTIGMSTVIGHGLAAVGGFLANKIINYTQLAQPVVMSPLMHHGRIFAGGIPIRKMPASSWNTMFAKWDSSADVGYNNWLEDVWDEKMNWLKKWSGQYAVGDFFNNGTSSPR